MYSAGQGPDLQDAKRAGEGNSERSDKWGWGEKAITFLLFSTVEKTILLTPCKEEILQSLELDHSTFFPLKASAFVPAAIFGLALPFFMTVQD